MPCYVASKEFLIQLQRELLVERQKALKWGLVWENSRRNVFGTVAS